VTGAALQTLVRAELDGPLLPAVQALAQTLAQRGGNATAAVLYYGSSLRAETLEGVLDFYVLLDDVGAWPGSWLARLANRLLPPNVGYLELAHPDGTLRAKYAVMSCRQFQRRLRRQSLDTTIWARFCQPVLCVWARSAEDRDTVAALISDAITTAACWAVRLGPARASAADYWRRLFEHTYATELRVEKAGRATDLVGKYPERYSALLPLALRRADLPFSVDSEGALAPELTASQRSHAQHSWARRKRLGRPLNMLRLLKAAFTFEGGMDYVVWKIERHRGVRIEVAPWERRFPLLAAPGLYLRLRRQGILR
jgi:hypothetical protein